MGKIIGMDGRPIKSGNNQAKPQAKDKALVVDGEPQQLPTAAQITENLGALLAQLMMLFHGNEIDGFYVHSLGVLLGQLELQDKAKQQTAAEIQIMAQKEAEAQLESRRVWLLQQSIPAGTKLN